MNIQTETNIHEVWDNVYYDRNDKSIDFYNEDDTMFVHGVSPESIIQMFRNATCAGCNCAKLQDMNLPQHAKDMLGEIAEALKAWNDQEIEKAFALQADAAEQERQGAETMAAAML